MLASIVQEEPIGLEEVLDILDEASQVIAYSRQLEQKSQALEQATAELRAANERLQELDRLKDDFISTVTHELRTPLTSIRALSEIPHSGPDVAPHKRGEFIAIIVKESERLTRLINQVLDLSKLESGSAQWHATHVHLPEVIRDAPACTSQLARERGISVNMRLSAEPPAVQADRDRLMQVLLNLLSNAVKFCPREAGRILVALDVLPGFLRIDVSDNGPGIAKAHHDVIFEKFRQVGDPRTGKPAGTGLGLPISRRIVEHLGGRMWVRSECGRGATFSFTVPLTVPRHGAAATVDAEARPMKTVLIVDDEPSIVVSLEYLLQRAGYRVLVAHDGEEAVECLGSQSPDLVLLDLMLPCMTGYEVCKRVRSDARHAGMKIVMLTARGREVERTKGLALGADAYVTKPFSTDELLEQLRAQLGEA